jgi:ABC-type branched-subunit amino acid transport system substrate-binding protein
MAWHEGDELVGRYTLEERVGAGGMGVVWRATDTLLDRVVALKQVRVDRLGEDDATDVRDRVAREARAAARLHHPHAVTVFDVVEDAGDRWLVMEYLPSRSLDDLVKADGPLEPRAAARCGVAVAEALAAAHAAGMVHRDVKPANVLMGHSGVVKLADFGISVVMGDTRLTQTGVLVGTLGYLAPEVANGADATPASDVFSLGATLYAAVEGRAPFAADGEANPFRLLRAAAEGDYPPPRNAGPLTDVLSAMMCRDPAERPTAVEAAAMLTEVADSAAPSRTTALLSAPPSDPAPRAARRIRPALVAGALMGIVAATAAVLVATRGPAVVAGSGSAAPAGIAAAPTTAAAVPCDPARTTGTVAIGVIAPLSGNFSPLGVGIRNSAQLAVDKANARCAVPGRRIELRIADDAGDAAKSAQVAGTLVTDPAVAGVVGPLNTAATEAVAAVLGPAGIAQVAPASTNPALTLGTDPASPHRPYPNLFRMLSTDLQQGPAAAAYLMGKALSRVAVVDDGSTYGTSLTRGFTARFGEIGGTVATAGRIDRDASDYGAVVAQVAASKPQAVYYGGDYPEAGKLAAQLSAAGVTAPLMGADGLLDAGYVRAGGRAGDLATSLGAPAELLPSATTFVADYTAAKFAESATNYGPPAYDAVQVLAAAIAAAAPGPTGPVDRAAVLGALQRTKLDGVLGPISFDQFGDITRKLVTVYTVRGRDFTPVTTTG